MSRRVIIMRGLPGAGKTYWTLRFCIENKTSVCVVSADIYHYEPPKQNSDGTLASPIYNFKPENARKAHDWCLKEFITATAGGWEVIIVDNTNLSAWEIAPYYRLAEVMEMEVEIVWIRVPVLTCIARNIHNVPEAVYEKMADRLERETLPPWWKQTIINKE